MSKAILRPKAAYKRGNANPENGSLDLAAWRSLVTLNKQFSWGERDGGQTGVGSRQRRKTGIVDNEKRQFFLRGLAVKGRREMENGAKGDAQSRGAFVFFCFF